MAKNYSSFEINDRCIGDSQKPFVIAEIAQAHDGSLGIAHAYIDAAAEVGADAVKFQTHIASAESTLDEPFRIKFSKQDESRFAYWQRMEFSPEQWSGLADHAREKGLVFLSSPFSLEALSLLSKLDVPMWKVASGEVSSGMLLDAMIDTGKPILISSGMSYWSELDKTITYLRQKQASYGVFQCTSMYPTPLDKVGLNVLDEMRGRYQCPIGLSDHSGNMYPAMVALAQGVDLLEIHLTMDHLMFGPDTSSSLNIPEFRQVCEFRDAIFQMKNNPVEKDLLADDLRGTRDLFMRSVALKCDLKAGTVITEDLITAKKPGTGIPYSQKDSVIGKTLVRDVTADRLVCREDLNG